MTANARGAFVTGTDTGAGKTLAACALIHALRARRLRVAPMKPVAAGLAPGPGTTANADTLALLAAAGWSQADAALVTPLLLREPMAPHIAAAREGRVLMLGPILEAFARLQDRSDVLVAEGVGGFLVPLSDGLDGEDLARALGLPVVMVVGLRLGCLNHALLTAARIAGSGLPFAGWIASEVDPAMAAKDENVEALLQRIPAPLLGRLPHAAVPDPRKLAPLLDVAPLLR